jgi:hypothetical protein
MKEKRTPRNVWTRLHVRAAHYQWTTPDGTIVRGCTIEVPKARCHFKTALRKIYA